MKWDLFKRDIPTVTRDQMVEVDRIMVEELGVMVLQMMEKAGSHLANLAVERFLGGYPDRKKVTILAGRGGNGGGAMASARFLAGRGVQTTVVTMGDPTPESAQGRQLEILKNYEIEVLPLQGIAAVPTQDLIIDGLVGYSLVGALKGDAEKMVEWANSQPAPVLSLDLPSGLEANLGLNHGTCMVATATLTLALPKDGLYMNGSDKHVGELYLADIGIPQNLYGQLDPPIEIPRLLWESGILRLSD